MKIYSRTGTPYQWLLWAWICTAVLTLPALFCIQPLFSQYFKIFCSSFGQIAWIAQIFGPALLMPLFIVLIMTRALGLIFYPNEKLLIWGTKFILALAAILCALLFIVPISTLTVPEAIAQLIQNPRLKYLAQIILYALWLAPAGMLYLLALFMIQFGLLRKTLTQGYKPLLMYILGGGITAVTFGAFATVLGNYFPNPIFVPIEFRLAIYELNPIIKAILNPYNAILLDLLAPLPMIILFKKFITDKIELPKA